MSKVAGPVAWQYYSDKFNEIIQTMMLGNQSTTILKTDCNN